MDASDFVICSTTNRGKGCSLGQLIFGRDMTLPIKHRVYWDLIRQQKQAQINRYNTRKNRHRVDYYYKVGYNAMHTKHTAYKYETPYVGPFVIKRCLTNGTVSLQVGTTKIRYNIRPIKPYISDT